MCLGSIPERCDSGLPWLCCGATWSYQEFLSVTPLGVALCSAVHLENLFAGHADNPLQNCITNMSLGLAESLSGMGDKIYCRNCTVLAVTLQS